MTFKMAGILFRSPKNSPFLAAVFVGLMIALLGFVFNRGNEILLSWGLGGFFLYVLTAYTEGSAWQRWLLGVLVCLLSTIAGNLLWFALFA